MTQPARAETRPPFGIRNWTLVIGGCLVLGAVPLAIGVVTGRRLLSALGLCLVMLVPFLFMGYLAARRQRLALEAGDEGLVIEAGSEREAIPWGDITGVSVANVSAGGRTTMLTLETRDGQKQIGTMALPPEALAEVVAVIRARTS